MKVQRRFGWLRSEGPAAWGWVLGYTAVLAGLSVLRYRLWLPGDGWIYEQGMWLLLHRGIGAVSTYMGDPILADDTEYVLLPLATVYHLGGPYAVFVLQAFAFGIGYFLIRKIGSTLSLDGRVSHMLGLVYFIYPAVIGANLFDFHPDAFGVPLLFGAIWCSLVNRWGTYLVLILAALLVKDTVPIVVFGMGVALLCQRKYIWGWLTAALGAAAAYVDVGLVIPALSHAQMRQWRYYYGYLGPSPLAGATRLLHNPALLFGWVLREDGWVVLAFLLAPLLAILLICRASILTALWLPGLALCEVNLLALHFPFTSPFAEEYALCVPSFFSAVLVALAGRRRNVPTRTAFVAWLVLPVCAFLVLGVIAYAWWRDRPVGTDTLQAAITTVPGEAPVVAPDFAAAHLANRDRLWVIGLLQDGTELPVGTYVVLDSRNKLSLFASGSQRAWLQARLTPGRNGSVFEMVYVSGNVTVGRLLRPIRFTARGDP